MAKKISRRGFIKYGVALGAAFGVPRLPIASAAEFIGGPPPARIFDVVIAGTGVAGMSAAVSAAQDGMKVALLDKQQRGLAGAAPPWPWAGSPCRKPIRRRPGSFSSTTMSKRAEGGPTGP